MKRILAMVVSVVLVATMAIGGSIAYLQDSDSAVNTMTLGKVDIVQIEQEWNDDQTELVDFEQLKPLYPYVGEISSWENDTDADGAYRRFAKVNNVVDKYISVENSGKSDAYVRTIFAFELGKYDLAEFDKLIGLSTNAENGSSFKFSGAWNWEGPEVGVIDGRNYAIMTAMHKNAVAPKTTTIPSLLQVYMDKTATNEDCENFDGNGNGLYDILVVSQAVQTLGFEDANNNGTAADEALDEAFGSWKANNAEKPDKTNLQVWFGSMDGKTVTSDKELADALAAETPTIVVNMTGDMTYDVAAWQNDAMGGEITETITILGNGHTLTFYQTNSDWNNVVTQNGAKLILKDVNITNSGHNDGPWNRHDINFGCDVELVNVKSDKALAFKAGATLKNVTISDPIDSDTYAIWIQPKGQTIDIDGLTIDMLACKDGRGIKIDNQYLAAEDDKGVTLNVKNAVFKTEEKGAILVKSAGDVAVTLENVDISRVQADPTHAVWVDEATAQYAEKTKVTGGEKIVEGAVVTVKATAASKDALNQQLTNAAAGNATSVVIDANGENIDLNYGLSKTTVPAGTTVILENANVSGKSYGNAVNGTVVFKDCTFENPTGAYSIHFDAGSGHVVFDSCTLKGWCSFGSAIKSVDMVDCTIEGNGIYAMNRFYQDTTMTNCKIDCSKTNTTDVYVDGISAVGCTVTLNNCTVAEGTAYEVSGGKIVKDGVVVAEDK